MYSSMYIDLALARCDQCIFVHIHMRNSKGYTKSEPSWRRVFGPVSSFCLIWYHYLEQNRTFGLYTCIYTYRYNTLCAILGISLCQYTLWYFWNFFTLCDTLCAIFWIILFSNPRLLWYITSNDTLCRTCVYTYVYVYKYICMGGKEKI